MICASIGHCTVEKCLRQIKKAKCAEIRIDLVEGNVGPEEVRRLFSAHKNLIAACRPGKKTQEECANLLIEAIDAGAAYVDIELEMPSTLRKKVAEKAKDAGCELIVSHHDFEKTPKANRLEEIVAKCFESGADIAKIACKSNSEGDCGRLLSLLDRKWDGKISVIAMGNKGRKVRIEAPLRGSAIAYIRMPGIRGTAEGQMTERELLIAQKKAKDEKIRIFAIAGRPVMHSASPRMHNAGFAAAKMHAVYTRLSSNSMKEALAIAKQTGMAGLNVTTPFKDEAFALADDLDGNAKATNAVNLLIIGKNGKTKGYNTDVDGVVGALYAAGVKLEGKKTLVLGAGGAARAAAYALCKSGARVTIANRTAGKAKKIAAKIKCEYCALKGKSFENAMARADVIVSALSTSERVISPKLLKKGTILFDANYASETSLSKDANKAGCKVIGGKEWLLHQGYAAFEKFARRKAPKKALMGAVCRKTGNVEKKNIAVIGFTGSGKSTVAKELGRRTGRAVWDTDEMVEKEANVPVYGIFKKFGEKHFRKIEARMIQMACKKKNAIISVAGGALLNPNNTKNVKESCTSIWLWASIDEILARLEGDNTHPLLDVNGKKKIKVVMKLMNARLPTYASCADMVIGTDKKTPKKVSEMILDEIHNA